VRICFDDVDALTIDVWTTVQEIVGETALGQEITLAPRGHVVLALARDFVLRLLVLDDDFYDWMYGDGDDDDLQSRCHGVVFGVERGTWRIVHDHFYDDEKRILLSLICDLNDGDGIRVCDGRN